MDQLSAFPPAGAIQLLGVVNISPRDEWANTNIILKQCNRYFFRASGTWWDAWNRCDANGYDLSYMRKAKCYLRCRDNGATWFTLIGGIDKATSTLFVIGDGSRWRDGWISSANGHLNCFANDVPGFYWNNFSHIRLEVWK